MATPPIRSGVLAAVATPLTPDLVPDIGRWAAHCRWLLDHGCHALAPFGTTGEANSFTVEERLASLEALVAAGIPAGKLIVGTGCCALPDTIALSVQAIELGCAGCLVLPPFYYKDVSDQGLIDAFSVFIESVDDPRLNVYLYHFPAMTHVQVPVAVAARLKAAYPDTVIGIKDSSGDLDNMKRLIAEVPGLAVFAGSDELLYAILEAGGAGSITAVANIAAYLCREVFDHWHGGDKARAWALQEDLTMVRRRISSKPQIAAVKACVARLNGEPEWQAMRPPLVPLSEEAYADLFDSLDGLGFRPPMVAG